MLEGVRLEDSSTKDRQPVRAAASVQRLSDSLHSLLSSSTSLSPSSSLLCHILAASLIIIPPFYLHSNTLPIWRTLLTYLACHDAPI